MPEEFQTKIVFSKQEGADMQLLRVFEFILSLQPESSPAKDKDEIYETTEIGIKTR